MRTYVQSAARPEVAEPLDVREITRPLDREDEAVGCLLDPACHGVSARQPVEGRVHLDGVEAPGVELEPARGRQLRRGEDAVPPVGGGPPREAHAGQGWAGRLAPPRLPPPTPPARRPRASGAPPA